MIRVFILAPTPLAQAGLHAMLSTIDLQVVGMASAPDALAALQPSSDVIVVADELQLEDIIAALDNTHNAALVVLSDNNERIIARLSALPLRSWGIVPLDTSAVQLQAALTAVNQGLLTLPASASQWVNARPPVLENINLPTGEDTLTPREHEVLELVSQGLSNKLIARQLTISEHTVKFHLSSLSAKLGASSRTDAVRLGLRRGLITL